MCSKKNDILYSFSRYKRNFEAAIIFFRRNNKKKQLEYLDTICIINYFANRPVFCCCVAIYNFIEIQVKFNIKTHKFFFRSN